MQQTTKYQFNLIEGGDDFSPNPLNENMEKVENALTDQAESLTAAMAEQAKDFAAALGSGGSTCRIAYGSYTGTGVYGFWNRTELTFAFCPALVIVGCANDSYTPTVMLRGCTGANTTGGGFISDIVWTDTGLTWHASDAGGQRNAEGVTYFYMALGTGLE